MKVILAPHLDDEVIGCFSVLTDIDKIYYFSEGRGGREVPEPLRYCRLHDGKSLVLPDDAVVYIPSHFDLHPLHRIVHRIGLSLPGKKMFYSVEMNTPWLEEEGSPESKRALFEQLYPNEKGILSQEKYFLFRSIKPFDEIIWASVRFQMEGFHCWPDAPKEVGFLRNQHRHLFHIQADVQQFNDARDLEYFILSRKVQAFARSEGKHLQSTSCETIGRTIKRWLEIEYPERLVRVSVYEDGENGCVIE